MTQNKQKSSALSRWAVWAGKHPGRVFLIAIALTAVMAVGASLLEMEMTFFSIMPQNSPQVRDLKKITEEFPFASSLVVVIDGRELPPESAKATVIDVIDEMTLEFSGDEYASAIAGVYSKVDTEFLNRHAFLLTEPDVLDRMTALYADTDLVPFLTALNDDLEREYSGDGDALEDDENQITSWVGGIEQILISLADSLEGDPPDRETMKAALDAYLIGDPYYLSRSEDMGLVFLNPTYTINDLGPLVEETDRVEERAKSIAAAAGVRAGLTGITVVGRDEMVTSEQGFALSMALAFVLILTLMIVVFRIRSTPFIIGIPLMMGIVWTVGMTGFIIHRLNIITAMYMVALIGLGVDYAIHLMTGFVQERDLGRNFSDSIGGTFAKSGRGIVTGALTTAAAFFALLLAESEIVRELAVVAGTGILCELAAMFILVPALLGWRQKRLDKKDREDPMLNRSRPVRSDFASTVGKLVSSKPGAITLLLLLVGIGLGTQAPKVEMEDNLMNMEAEGLDSIELQDLMVDEFGAAPDVMYLIIDRNELPGLPAIIDQLEDLDSVKFVDAVTKWWPTENQRTERLPYLLDIRSGLEIRGDGIGNRGSPPDPELLLEELYRLEFNLIEMGDLAVLGGTDRAAHALNRITGLNNDGDKVAETAFDRLFTNLETTDSEVRTQDSIIGFQSLFSPELTDRIYTMAGTGNIALEDLPAMTRETFLSEDGTSTLVSISPRENPWEGRYRNVFTTQVNSVTDRGTGMILAADQLIAIAEKDGARSMITALIAVFIILLIDFRNIRMALLTFLPLGLAFASLYGLMAIFGIKFDFVNIIAIPLLVGIGIDDSVHINHRYLLEGRGRMNIAIAGTGSAVALTTLTTMIGFSSFIPSIMRAMRSTGIVLTLAMALAFIYSILFHPALLILVSERLGWNLSPRFLKQGDAK